MKYFSLILAFFLVQAATAQNTIGTTAYTPDAVDDGYTLLYPHNQPNVYLLDLCGEVVHTWTNDAGFRPGNVAYFQENGDLVFTYRPQVFANDAIWAGGGGQTVERRTWDNEVLWIPPWGAVLCWPWDMQRLLPPQKKRSIMKASM